MSKLLGIAGYSGSGKTTLLEKVIPLLIRHGLRVSVIKHAHHNFDIDRPGKDSFRHREAGAHEVLLASGHRWVLMHELREEKEPSLEELCARLSPCDLVLIEGYKFSALPKIEVHRAVTGHPPLYPNDPNIIAVATDDVPALRDKLNSVRAEPVEARRPPFDELRANGFPPPDVLDIDDAQQVADHIFGYFAFVKK